MRIHHLNCASMCPWGRRGINGDGRWLEAAHLCCHCLLIESRQGLILVDTGLGLDDVRDPRRLPWAFRALTRPRLQVGETAWHQIRALGLDPRDVRHIVPTHLDLDHAGGLADFPQAQVHIHHDELDAALQRSSWAEQQRYVPAQWAHGPLWRALRPQGETWMGLQAVRALPGTDDEVLLVPLIGHTRGHCGVAVRGDAGWMLHAGDAYFHQGDMTRPPTTPMGLRLLQFLVQTEGRQRLTNQERLRELIARASPRSPASACTVAAPSSGAWPTPNSTAQMQNEALAGLQVFCAHDPHELQRMRALQAQTSANLGASHEMRGQAA